MTVSSSWLTRGDLLNTLRGLQFATAQMGLDLPGALGETFRAGFETALAAVAVSFGVAGELDSSKPPTVTVVTVPERFRLGVRP